MFKNFPPSLMADTLKRASSMRNRAVMFAFSLHDGAPVVTNISTYRGACPSSVSVDMSSGRAVVPTHLSADEVCEQISRKLAGYSVDLLDESGNPWELQCVVVEGSARRKLQDPYSILVRISSDILERLDSIVDGPKGARAAAIEYGLERLINKMQSQADKIGPGVRIGLAKLSVKGTPQMAISRHHTCGNHRGRSPPHRVGLREEPPRRGQPATHQFQT